MDLTENSEETRIDVNENKDRWRRVVEAVKILNRL